MKRRKFLKYASVGLASLTIGLPACNRTDDQGRPGLTDTQDQPSGSLPVKQDIQLSITEALIEMVDATPVYSWVFDAPETGPRFPGPVINLIEGDPITISLTNTLDEDHAFAVPDIVDSGPLKPGETKIISFTAPAAGTYLYMDPLNAPVNRALGLHGAMVVLPKNAGNNPYTSPTAAVTELFNDLGTSAHFPGEPWNPARTRIWLFFSIDPRFNDLAMRGTTIDPVTMTNTFLPRYFTINGVSGAYASHSRDIAPSGRIGQPHLIRILNAGLDVHSPHLHGNHVYVVALHQTAANSPLDELAAQEKVLIPPGLVPLVDTFSLYPLDRMDWLLPFMRPPDIPGDPNTPLRDLLKNELALVLGDVPQSPLTYPMHGHDELSQTAAGGNYPQGLVTHWEITGDLDGVDFPVPLVR